MTFAVRLIWRPAGSEDTGTVWKTPIITTAVGMVSTSWFPYCGAVRAVKDGQGGAAPLGQLVGMTESLAPKCVHGLYPLLSPTNSLVPAPEPIAR
jgi:hypothetical protein